MSVPRVSVRIRQPGRTGLGGRYTSEGLPIGDTFPNEQLFALVHYPWYVDIVNYLVTGKIPSQWTSQQKRKFLVDIKKYYFDDPNCLNIVLTNCYECVYPMTIKLGYSPFVTMKLVEGISLQEKWLTKSWKPVFIGPLFLKSALTFAKLVLGANN